MTHTPQHKRAEGSIIVITIVFTAVFVTLLASLLGYLLGQYRWVDARTEEERALQIAEAGIEYYRWHLAHFPDDIQDGTGVAGPYVHVYEDPETGAIGEFSLEIGGDVFCNEVQVVKATSTGYTYKDPNNKRSIAVTIARPTVADYSYIVDSPVYAGSSRTILGPYHGNSVVRMDADNLSSVTSKITTTTCGAGGLGGCGSSGATIDGVYGAGTHPEWWQSGVAEIPFTNFDYSFGTIEQKAIDEGIHLPKISNDASGPYYGYYLELKGDKTVDIYKVKTVNLISSKLGTDDTIQLRELLGPTTYSHSGLDSKRDVVSLGVPIPQACPLIYVSDRTWLEGEVSGKVTVVANDTGTAEPDLFLQDNITYQTGSDVDGLTVLAEGNLLIPLYVPDDMEINGVFFAQKGAYGRNFYKQSGYTCSGCTDIGSYGSYRLRDTLTTNGTIISKLRTGTAWGTVQGFSTRYDNYDRNLAKNPPPRTPFTSQNFRFIEWREVE